MEGVSHHIRSVSFTFIVKNDICYLNAETLLTFQTFQLLQQLRLALGRKGRGGGGGKDIQSRIWVHVVIIMQCSHSFDNFHNHDLSKYRSM